MRKLTNFLIAGAGVAGFAALKSARRRNWIDLAGKVVLITGGSRGLGLQMAREFGARGAKVAICARDASELERAAWDLRDRNIEVCATPCDVSDRSDVASMVKEVVRTLGPIDVLVNNAGIIQVGPFSHQTTEDFERAMDVIFWGTLYCTLAVLPSMRERQKGSIVNITSIGAKVSVPHLIPYSCAKFAALALSEGLRAELSGEGIRVTTIVPGLMRTGSHLQVELKGDHVREYVWFSAGAAAPLFAIGAERAARSIVRATIRGESERTLSLPAHVLARFHGILPGLNADILGLVHRFVLPAAPPALTGSRTGFEAREQLDSRFLEAITKAGQRAAESLNELSPAM